MQLSGTAAVARGRGPADVATLLEEEPDVQYFLKSPEIFTEFLEASVPLQITSFNMFSRVSAIALLALPLLAAAGGYEPSSQCNTGPVQCCNNIRTAETLVANHASLGSLLSAFVGPATAILGGTTSDFIHLALPSQSAAPATSSLINVGCTPINANL
ncbi:hypothetical protein CVT25_014280 [Psilocybe cyanescens]|uniref:Hydrophobin n=1 Tax=Psilocybe cyanescens TaxID=93625 RepID=A0A409WUC3_PSICY|nr:hypothetical protein CVT25_014280 [Psilocybe cyanescens]